jgi:hypothetical protein
MQRTMILRDLQQDIATRKAAELDFADGFDSRYSNSLETN